MIGWWRKMLRLDRKDQEAEDVRRDAERRLGEVRGRWSEVHQARSTLAEWVEQGLRKGA